MLRWLRTWFGFAESPSRAAPASRLSADQALDIARRAAAGESLSEHLVHATFQLRDGRPVWCVSSATIGLILEVTIDDETGGVLEKKTVGIR